MKPLVYVFPTSLVICAFGMKRGLITPATNGNRQSSGTK
jgi:hypothetical protein